MKKLLVSVGIALALSTVGGATASAAPPSEPPTADALRACAPHGAPGTVNLPHAPFCPL
jgi:hypothetical protein